MKEKKYGIFEKLAERVDYYLPATRNCAQTSFAALRDAFGLPAGSIFRGLTPFPDLAGRGGTCGAVTGCLITIGLVFGTAEEKISDRGAWLEGMTQAREFCDTFGGRYGSIRCSEIAENLLGSPEPKDVEQRRRWNEHRYAECSKILHDAVRITAEILLRDSSAGG